MELQVDPKIEQNPVKEGQSPLKQEYYLCDTCQTTVAKEKSDYHEQYLCTKIVKFNKAQLSSKLRQQSKPISKLEEKQHPQSKHNNKSQQHTSAKLYTKSPMQQQLISGLSSIRKTNSNTYQELNEEENVEQKPQRNIEQKPKKKRSQIKYVEKKHQDHLSKLSSPSHYKQRKMNLPISEIKKVPSKVYPSSNSSIKSSSKSSQVRSNRAAAAAPMRKQQSELKEGKVQCSSCKKMIPFELIDDHEFTCSLSVECQYCGLPLIITQLQEHQKTCQIKELWEKEQHNHYSHKQQSYYQGVYDDGEELYENDFHCEHMHHHHNHHSHHHHNHHYDQELEDDFEIDQWEGQNKKHKGLTHSKLGKLNFSSYKKPKNQQQSQSRQQQPCAICYMQFQHHETVIKLPCLHIFHPQCVGKWLETDDRCPMCKVNVT